MSSQLPLFSDIEPILLQYKNAHALTRKDILLDAITGVQKLSGEIISKDEAKEHYKVLSYTATLINYADILNRMENQQFFDILFDFYKMDLDAELCDWFEFGSPGQMRLKKPISEYTPETWEKFRSAQKDHLKKIGKANVFNLEQLDINNPPTNQLYPIQIQMLRKLFNESVDRISVNAKGQIRFAKRHGLYQLPGGGMVETSAPTIEELTYKMLEEHLEEEHANLYIKAAPLYNELDKTIFDQRLLEVLDRQQAKSLPDNFQKILKKIIKDKNTNAQCLRDIINAIDEQKENEKNDHGRKSLIELRALMQAQTFELTPLFAQAVAYTNKNAKCINIKQYLDARAAGGFQISHVFIFNHPLEEWFEEKFNGVNDELGDDISGAEIERLTLLESIAQFKKIKFSHLLIGLAAYNEALDNHRLQISTVWDNDQFDVARKAIVSEVT
ncbi:hypothetical protein [Legionella cincinnatiensis]|uniref:Uncharacterized protein n=1 Tax=Legionella cincinnatiensis TaxID=28085 RepID=A0A378II40_9GAMM|nr:hypothetical protein [Legionella cincinnatiensis]KTC82740.1 hypothetical protein Lcin_2769 [Legionella cincinnatiensis]STX34171.1 Uncharacterised protein [Legionella cincinnatiensis]